MENPGQKEIQPMPPRSRLVLNRSPGLPERGKIKIGMKGEERKSTKGAPYKLPTKLDHFLVTTLDRGTDGNFLLDKQIHDKLGADPKSIPVTLLWNDIAMNVQSRYASFSGATVWCSGDGEQADRQKGDGPEREMVACPCKRLDSDYTGTDKCKINGVLSVLIEGAGGVGGIWKFRTTSFNTVDGLVGSMSFIKSITSGVLAGIPLNLTINPKNVLTPAGAATTIYVVGLEYAGTMEELREVGYQRALTQSKSDVRMADIEKEARGLLGAPEQEAAAVFPGEDTEDVAAEFYPGARDGLLAGSRSDDATRALEGQNGQADTEAPPEPEQGAEAPETNPIGAGHAPVIATDMEAATRADSIFDMALERGETMQAAWDGTVKEIYDNCADRAEQKVIGALCQFYKALEAQAKAAKK